MFHGPERAGFSKKTVSINVDDRSRDQFEKKSLTALISCECVATR
ncbi:hypothetical protein RMSM_02820 [Rhodopirellula maiorica SM1]|uniref:Uncharacterized protein n=1 Tax=Rhodopirellula maiorica SM1 TaxID=1265738 RepID=M5S242_9BACT|nr:hypothetical protein RMSM_02820 [Rhodopirellula maiorica SM1]